MKHLLATLLIATGLMSSTIYAHEYTHGDLLIDHPYTRTTPPSAPVAGGFMKITNNGKEADTLIGGNVDFSEVVEIHEMPMINGVMHMRQLEDGLEIPPGETVELKPGGFHVMFIKLKEQMIEGEKHKATLTFKKAGDVEVEFVVKDISDMMGKGMKHDMKHGEDKGKMNHDTKHGDQQSKMDHKKQLSEMPDLMRVVLAHGDKLDLSDEQQSELKQWRTANNEKIQTMAKDVKTASQKLLDLALDDADNAALQEQYTKIAMLRKAIVDGKIACRSNMKRVLDDKQYQTLQSLYKENFVTTM